MPGRTKCPTCGRPYQHLPDKTCDWCSAAERLPIAAPEPVREESHVPPSSIFRGGNLASRIVLIVLVVALGVAAVAYLMTRT